VLRSESFAASKPPHAVHVRTAVELFRVVRKGQGCTSGCTHPRRSYLRWWCRVAVQSAIDQTTDGISSAVEGISVIKPLQVCLLPHAHAHGHMDMDKDLRLDTGGGSHTVKHTVERHSSAATAKANAEHARMTDVRCNHRRPQTEMLCWCWLRGRKAPKLKITSFW